MIAALTMPVAAAGTSWVIGKIFIKHFASGGIRKDAWSGPIMGVLFAAIGVGAYYAAKGLPTGRGAQMGPGAMPLILSAMLVLLGLIAAIEGLVHKRTAVPASLAPLFWVLAAVAAFGLTVQPLGLSGAIILASGIVASYTLRSRTAAIILVVAVSVIIALVIAYLFDLPMSLWPRLRGL